MTDISVTLSESAATQINAIMAKAGAVRAFNISSTLPTRPMRMIL